MGCFIENIKEKLLYDNKALNRFILCKEAKFKSTIDLLSIKKIQQKKVAPCDVNKSIGTEELYLNVKHFLDVIKKNFPEEYLNNLYNNLSVLQIDFVNNKLLKKAEAIGIYYTMLNKILILKDYDPNTLYHELFHVSSNDLITNSGNEGLCYYKDNQLIGDSLNEGYTQLLSERYFDLPKQSLYTFEKTVARLFENIIGKEFMEKAYLTSDLESIIKKLHEDFSLEEMRVFLDTIDILSYLKGRKFPFLTEYIYDKIEVIICFLLKGYCISLNDTNLSIEQIKKTIQNDFGDLLCCMIGNPTFDSYLLEKMQKIIDKYLNCNLNLSDESKKI